jgi:murein L,D-transpeptidase YcbB/YkuD
VTKPVSSVLRTTLAVAFLTGLLLPMAGCKSVKRLIARFHHRKATSKPNTADYADTLQQVVASPQLAMLKWPNYADDQAAVQKFYDDRDEELAWTRGGRPTPQATRLIEMFGDAAKKGLDPEDYDASRWAARVQKLEAIRAAKDDSDAAQQVVADFDVAMTITAMRYLEDLHVGRVNPQTLNFDIDQPAKRAAFDVETLMNDDLVDADDVSSVVESVEPQSPMYKATELGLPKYLELAKAQSATPQEPLPALPAGTKPVVAGGSYAAVAQLVSRLQFEGDAAADLDGTKGYTKEVAAAVKQYQSRHGLTEDGKLGQGTIDSLNVPMSKRVQQFDDSLERWRWLPDNYVRPRVFVNLPEFIVRTYEPDHTLAFKMRVVDGEAKGNHDTPMFVRLMRYVVFRPYWNLPPSIIKKEIMPHIARSGLGYLESHDYEVYKNDGSVVTSYTANDLAHLRYSVRQRPGPKNSLGLVKFLFPNEYDVYMHSTPELPLFELTRRDKSHGCVRLQHADQMALWVLHGDQADPDAEDGWDADKIDTAMNGEDNNKTIGLKKPLPVVIGYFTANGDEDGSVHFFDDIYGYDKELEAALAKGRPYARGEAKVNPKLTPGETE